MEKDMSLNWDFDLPAYLLGEIYGDLYQEGKRIKWTMQDSIDLAHDLALDGFGADPQEILELMLEFDRQDAEEAAKHQGKPVH